MRMLVWVCWFVFGTAGWAQPLTALLHIQSEGDSVAVAGAAGDWTSAQAGAELTSGMRLRLVRGTAQVFYPNGEVVRLTPGVEHQVRFTSADGEDWTEALDRGWKALAGALVRAFRVTEEEAMTGVVVQGSARGGHEAQPPILAAPSSGPWPLLNLHPTFTWYPSSADAYRITVETAAPDCRLSGTENVSLWHADTSWTYPAEAPDLKPGATYRLRVTAGAGEIQDRSCFRTARASERDSLDAETTFVRRILAEGVDGEDRAQHDIVVALFLAERGYPVDGLMMLDGLLERTISHAAASRARRTILEAMGTTERVRRER